MYEFVDRPVTGLDRGGRFLIWSMRNWVKAKGEGRCPVHAIGSAFARWKMTSGLLPFLRIMALFNNHGRETFGFCAMGCNHISEHEAIILSLVCSLQDARPQDMHTMACLLVEEPQVDDLILSLSVLGRSLATASIFPARGVSANGNA